MPHTALPTSEATVDWHAQELLLLSQVVRGLGRGAGGGVDSSVVLREMLHLMSELLGLNRGRIVLAVGDGDDTADPLQGPFGAARPASAGAPSSRIQHAYGLTREEVARGRYGPGEGVTGRVMRRGSRLALAFYSAAALDATAVSFALTGDPGEGPALSNVRCFDADGEPIDDAQISFRGE